MGRDGVWGVPDICPPLLQIRRRRPTPASLVLSSDQSSPGGSPFVSRCHPGVRPGVFGWHNGGSARGRALRCVALRVSAHPSPGEAAAGGARLQPPLLCALPGMPGTSRGLAMEGRGGGGAEVIFESFAALLPPPGLWGRDVTLPASCPIRLLSWGGSISLVFGVAGTLRSQMLSLGIWGYFCHSTGTTKTGSGCGLCQPDFTAWGAAVGPPPPTCRLQRDGAEVSVVAVLCS